MSDPLVSCIMPTWNRRTFIPAAIQCFLEQIYENLELVIVDDGNDKVADLVPADSRIRYIPLDRKLTTGEKRNYCCRVARGEIICHMDDDDWSAPGRISDQVKRLQQTGKPITGYGTLLFWDIVTREAKRYKPAMKSYICGTTFCYLRSFWQGHGFRDKQVASDNQFIFPVMSQVAQSQETRFVVARIHHCHHTSPKTLITEVVSRDLIPEGFWQNEALRLRS